MFVLKNIMLSALLLSPLVAVETDVPKKVNAAFEYDAANGWWWYKEKYDDGEKEFETKVKMTPKEKMEKDQEDEKIKVMKASDKKLAAIKERLEYAYPNITPKYTKNKVTGEPCLTNSKAECFVFPLQAEAQHVPVMAQWLSNPNPTNSKEWLRWQATYFNHITDIGYGNKFAYMNGGDEVYPTDNVYNNGDDMNLDFQASWSRHAELKNIEAVKDRMTALIFLGETMTLEMGASSYYQMKNWGLPGFDKWTWYMIFKSKESLDRYDEKLKLLTGRSNIEMWEKFKKEKLVVIEPNYFKKFNIEMTPTTVVLYNKANEGEKKDYIWSKVSTGVSGTDETIGHINQFLIYNKIIDPKTLSTGQGIKNYHEDTKALSSDVKVDNSRIYTDNNKIEVK